MLTPALLFRCARYGAMGLVLGSLALNANAQGQPYPNRSILAIYPYPAGSTADIFSRVFAAEVSAPVELLTA